MKAWPFLAIFVIQVLLLLAHWFVYSTVYRFLAGTGPPPRLRICALSFFVLAFSFVVASLLAFRFHNFAVRFLYWIAAIWLGFLNYFFWASWLVRLCGLVLLLIPKPADPPGVRPLVAVVLYALAALGMHSMAWSMSASFAFTA